MRLRGIDFKVGNLYEACGSLVCLVFISDRILIRESLDSKNHFQYKGYYLGFTTLAGRYPNDFEYASDYIKRKDVIRPARDPLLYLNMPYKSDFYAELLKGKSWKS